MGTPDRQPNRIPTEWLSDPDAAVQSRLATDLGRTAYLFALQLTRRPDLSQDIAQDSLVRFYRRIDRFDPSRPVEPWLYSIVRNQVRDQARRERHRSHESLDAWLEGGIREITDGSSTPEEAAELGERQRMVWAGIARLSDDHREILVLRDFHDLSYEELSEVLRIPRGTVMSRLHAARKNLRGLIRQLDGGGGLDG